MTDYPFAAWRRVIFVAALIVILVIAFAPSITQGTVNIRVYGFVPGGPVSHLYVKFSEVSLHTAGYPEDSGWVTLTNLLPRVDLVPQPNQLVPESIISARIQSGRYDAIKLVASNSTLVLASSPGVPISTGSTVNANVTLPIPPNGIGDVLFLLVVDYSALLSSQPTLSLTLLQATPV